MQKKRLIRCIIFSSICLLLANELNCAAQDAFSPLELNNTNVPNPQTTPVAQQQDIQQNEDDSLYFINATDKFIRCNIRASRQDFKNSIENSPKNDFLYMSIANKMADLGLFTLADLAVSKIEDNDIAGVSIDAIKRFYYPARKIKYDDELFLAEIYSNIMYNNQSSEAVNELIQNEAMLSNYDYANYLIALGSYKSGIIPQAKKYINLALIQNPNNINYQALKAKILAKDGASEDALKTVENIKKQNLYSYEYERKIKALEQFILYETSKPEWLKNYHLGYYYYLDGDNAKAVRTLQTALSFKKRANQGMIYELMSKVYLKMNEFEKASDSAKKAHKISRNRALLTLGDLSFQDKKYKEAISYYKKAASKDKKSYVPLVREAQTYQQLANNKKAKELYTKVLKTHFDSWEAYYNIAILDKDKETIYLKKALAVNPLFEDGWIQLAKNQIDKGNYEIAQKYLANAFYIDENDFKYYYYQGLLDKIAGDNTQAKNDFEKCLKLNSSFKDAQNELNTLKNIQDSI